MGTGYGGQTRLIVQWLKSHGHEPIVSAFHGLRDAIFNYEGVPVLPGSNEQWGNDVLVSHYDHYRPDVMFLLMDSWVLQPKVLDLIPAAVWTPIDHDPMPLAVFKALTHVEYPIAMSRHGERAMRMAGLDPYYAPHMVDTQQYQPLDRAEARRLFGVKDDHFFVSCVAANKGFPSRKNLDKLLHAWRMFCTTHPNSTLYLHTQPLPSMGGLDMKGLCGFYELNHHEGEIEANTDLSKYQVVFPSIYRMIRGDYTDAFLNTLHNAADAFILPSSGEGFGVPIIEAQASGCPVIVSDFTAQSELGQAGYRIPIDKVDDVIFTLQGSHQCSPKVSEIVKGLEWAYEHRGDTALRQQARDFALGYDTETVMSKYMFPLMQRMAQENADWMQFQRYRKQGVA